MKRLLFITTSSLAANPRLVKEFETLKNTHDCTVVCFKHEDWSFKLSQKIKKRNPEICFIEIDRKLRFFETVWSKVLHKLAIFINPIFQKNTLICAYASNDKTPQLVSALRQFRIKRIHTVIAHNLGTFFPAMQYSNYIGAKLQLDIEDFYPGEALYFNKKYEKENRFKIMRSSFGKADTITYASKGIALECQKQFKIRKVTKELIILNAFLRADFYRPTIIDQQHIKCVWFSQNIGPNRGLEDVFEAAKSLQHFQFYLIGNKNKKYLDGFQLSENIFFHDILPQTELHQFLSTMDIGMALEPGKDLNNDLALSNKLIAYAQTGLFIMASNTFGQRQFLEQLHYNAGTVMANSFLTEMTQLDKSVLSKDQKVNRWQNAKSFAWEEEQKKLIALIS